jgi:uncharacterized protein involved in tolerance to divalent cations
MVNIIIYLEKEHNAKDLVKHLLSEKLIASASIDENNISYELENNNFSEKVFSVITAQSKALLFNDVINAVTKKIGFELPINSIPIVASNKLFDTKIKSKTIPI